MTVKELKKLLELYDEDQIVQIPCNNPSLGGRQMVGIHSVSQGFDWESGVLLCPDAPILKKLKKKVVKGVDNHRV